MKKWHGKYKPPFAVAPKSTTMRRFVVIDWNSHEVVGEFDDYRDAEFAQYDYEDWVYRTNCRIYDRKDAKQREILERNGF